MFIELKSKVEHDGTVFEAGKTIEIDDVQAQLLVDSNVAEVAKAEKPKAEKPVVEEPQVEAKKPLKKMNKPELLAEAEKRGVEVSEDMTNDQIVEKLKGE